MRVRLNRTTTAALAAFGVGYVVGAVINDRPIRRLRRTVVVARERVSAAASTIAHATPVRLPEWTHRDGHAVVDVRRVVEVMRDPVSVRSKTSLREAAAVLQRSGASELVVVKKLRPRGIVTERDIASAVRRGLDPDTTVVRDVARPVGTVAASVTVNEAMGRLRHGADPLIVVSGDGLVIGLISASDASIAERFRALVARA